MNWRVVGASVQGASHQRQGLPCQDCHRWWESGDGVLVAAVADGCGSARHALRGAELAADAAVTRASERLGEATPAAPEAWHDLLREVLQHARDTLLREADAMQVPPSDLATTLLVVAVTQYVLASGQVGDGAVVARLADGGLRLVTGPHAEEYINETQFVTSERFAECTQLAVMEERITGLALLTDGLQMLALEMPAAVPYDRFFQPLLRLTAEAPVDRPIDERRLSEFLTSPPVVERAHDDLTLVLAVPASTCGERNP